jgi:predicted DNA-binding protein
LDEQGDQMCLAVEQDLFGFGEILWANLPAYRFHYRLLYVTQNDGGFAFKSTDKPDAPYYLPIIEFSLDENDELTLAFDASDHIRKYKLKRITKEDILAIELGSEATVTFETMFDKMDAMLHPKLP